MGMVTISPVNAVAKADPGQRRDQAGPDQHGQRVLGHGGEAEQHRAEIASLSRSSMSGTATTLIEKIKAAKPPPMNR
jgi:hypothetical protein